jgi:hypothetical protein
MSCILLADGSRISADKLIGNGADGFIILQGKHVLKTPHLLGRLRPDGKIEAHLDDELHFQHLEVETEVYKRLHDVPGIAKCIEFTNNGILLEYYPKGSLGEYIFSRPALNVMEMVLDSPGDKYHCTLPPKTNLGVRHCFAQFPPCR